MPKNKGKGGKNRRRGKNDIGDKRELVLKDEGQGTFLFHPPLSTTCLQQIAITNDPANRH